MDIRSILGASPDSNKVDKNNETRKIKSAEQSKDTSPSKGKVKNTGDKAEISSSGRELLALKTESTRYLDEVKITESLSAEEIDAIKEKVANDFYFQPEVIDKVVEKILGLPGFK